MDISGKTRLFGLIGSPVEHSKSPAMYNYCFDKWKLDYKYLAFDVDKNQISDAIQAFRTFQMKGANITMPCKQEVLKYLDEISPAARLVGACNTIVNHDGVLTREPSAGDSSALVFRPGPLAWPFLLEPPGPIHLHNPHLTAEPLRSQLRAMLSNPEGVCLNWPEGEGNDLESGTVLLSCSQGLAATCAHDAARAFHSGVLQGATVRGSSSAASSSRVQSSRRH